jgi:hypothetical protein
MVWSAGHCGGAYFSRVHRGTVGRYGAAVRQQLTSVIERDDTVAEQAPSLLRVSGDDFRGVVVGFRRLRTGRHVSAHGYFSLRCLIRVAGADAKVGSPRVPADTGGLPVFRDAQFRRGEYG